MVLIVLRTVAERIPRGYVKVLITGASGFIGRFLTEMVAGLGHEVYALVRNNVPCFPGRIHQVRADFNDTTWRGCLPGGVDVVIHLAQSRQYRDFPDGSADMFAVNVRATLELLEWSRKQRVRKLIFSSTGNIYKDKKGLLKESDPCVPSDMYAATKLCAEHLIQQYSKTFTTIICRLFTVYGPGQKNMLIPNFIERVQKGIPIVLAQNVGLYLTPIHVMDVCKAMVYLLENESTRSGSIFNISGDRLISLKEIVDVISSSLGVKAIIEVTDDEVSFLCGDSYHTSHFLQSFRNIYHGLTEIIRNGYCQK